jgi:hypothetical protein
MQLNISQSHRRFNAQQLLYQSKANSDHSIQELIIDSVT